MLRHRGLMSWFAVAVIVMATGGVGAPSATAQTPDSFGASLLSSTVDGVEFEVRVPWEQLSVQPVTADGKDYDSVTLPGWATTDTAGAPALPFLAQEIGVPFGVTLSVEALAGANRTVVLAGPVVPAATQSVEWGLPALPDGAPADPEVRIEYEPDSAVYDAGANYPGLLASVASDGVMRQQRVVGIAVYPVQYDPTRHELTIYESLTICVRFEGQATAHELSADAASAVVESAAYEEVYQASLLNYETARGWRAATTASVMPSDVQTAALPWAPPEPGWRIKVRADGMYKLSYTQLQAAGVLTANPDPRTFRMFYLGDEIAIHVEGQADGNFGSSDYVLFYGQALESKYTLDNIYWLSYGVGNGLRMSTRDCTPGTAQTPDYYVALRRQEKNVVPIYNGNAPGSASLDRWMVDYLYPPSRPSTSVTFAVPAPYLDSYTGRLRVALLGALDIAAINPDHHVRVLLNGTHLADVWWDGINWQNVDVQIAQDLLVVGDNIVTLSDPNDLDVGVDYVQLDWVEFEFANRFVAEAGELAFAYAPTGSHSFEISGYTVNDIAVFDVTSPTGVVRVTGAAITGAGSAYTVEFEDDLSAAKSYRALQSSAYKTVYGIETDTASNLRSTNNGADYVLITHPTFASQAQTLHNLRAGQQLRAKLVYAQDIYDEFGYGVTGAEALQGFLAYAYASWQSPAPSYVVLLGDGHYDPKNNGSTRTSYIPPYLAPVDPWIVETAADNRYVAVAGADILPDMMLGRLAVNTVAEATAIVNKIVTYDQSPVSGDWREQLLAVADNGDYAGDFPVISDSLLAACVPSSCTTTRVYLGVTHTTGAEAKAAILAGINYGKMIVNYIGHGYTNAWAVENLLKTSDVPYLTNGGKQPVILAMDCRDGYYIYPDNYTPTSGSEAVAEVITRADGKGAIASWSPTGMGVASGHDYLNRGFLEAWFQDVDGRLAVGQATMAGKLALWATGGNLDLIDTLLLFGDPATVLQSGDPTTVDLLSFTARGLDNAVAVRWVTSNEAETAGYNLYRARWPKGVKTKLNGEIIPTLAAPGSLEGALYRYRDAGLKDNVKYYYWLEIVDLSGSKSLRGPIAALTK